MSKNWKCAHCGYLNAADSQTCGQDEEYEDRSYGCGKPRRDANKEFGLVIMGSYRGKPIYDSDLRDNPELQQHEDFTLALGEGHLDALRFSNNKAVLDSPGQNMV